MMYFYAHFPVRNERKKTDFRANFDLKNQIGAKLAQNWRKTKAPIQNSLSNKENLRRYTPL